MRRVTSNKRVRYEKYKLIFFYNFKYSGDIKEKMQKKKKKIVSQSFWNKYGILGFTQSIYSNTYTYVYNMLIHK